MHTQNAGRRPFKALGAVAVMAILAAACSDSSSITSPALLSQANTGQSASFAVLANQAVTCTDGTIIGDVGTFQATPSGSVTQTSCPVTGSVHVGDGAAVSAYSAFLAQYAALAPQPGDVCPIITGTLAGQTFAPGTYCVSAEAKTGVVTLAGPANGIWIFKVAPGAFTGTNFTVVMAGGAQACNVTWWVDAATTMTDSNLKGNVLSGAAITLTRGTFAGNAWSRADVTVTGTAVTGCAGSSNSGNGNDNNKGKCNQGVGNGPEGCDPGNSNNRHGSNDENGGTPGDPGRKGGR